MQVAEFLSDLQTLNVCDHSAAIALVSARPPSNEDANESGTGDKSEDSGEKMQENDPDLARAKDLVELHYSMKVKLAEGNLDQELIAAREAVMRAINS